ncbi:MAG: hypothetical protein KDD58_12580 [Bdellovibrionales bacterium]|nr:hypothetical protein [Bdellovibrionales bacterium]
MIKLTKVFIYTIAILFTSTVFADDRFENLRYDQLIPEHCQKVKLADFAEDLLYFTVSIDDAQDNGFDYAYPIKRRAVTQIWKKALGAKAWGNMQPQNTNIVHPQEPTQDAYQTVMAHAPLMDFDLSSEGEILEILGTLFLYDEMSYNNFFITGSVAYKASAHSRVIGELDFIVADKTSCEIFAIGEAKLNNRKLGYAKKQLHRFQGFLADQKRQNNFWELPQLSIVN